jgi:uncharacterized membrane protein YidH (DUF202 family)
VDCVPSQAPASSLFPHPPFLIPQQLAMPQSSTNPPTADYGATASPVPVPVPSSSKPPSGSRIEPKVWLANERTWLNWCRTGVLLGSFGVALINSSVSAWRLLLISFISNSSNLMFSGLLLSAILRCTGHGRHICYYRNWNNRIWSFSL